MTTDSKLTSKVVKRIELNPNSCSISVLAKEAAAVLLFIKSKNEEALHATRNDLNLYFKADCDCKKTQRLTALILNLLQYGWLKHQADVENSRVYYWYKDFSSPFDPKKLFDRPVDYQDLYQAYLGKEVSEQKPVTVPATVSTVVAATNTEVATKVAVAPSTVVTKVTKTKVTKTRARISTKLIDPSLVHLLTRSQLNEVQYQPAQKIKYGVLKIVEFLAQARVENIIEVANAIGISKRSCEACLGKSKEINTVDHIVTLNEFGVSYLSQYESTRIQSDWLALVATNVLSQSNETDYIVSLLVKFLKTYPLDVQQQVCFLLK